MDRLHSIILIFCLLICAAACGYQTAPVPYSQADEKLPLVTQTTLRQQGNNWVFRWSISDETLLTRPPQEETETETEPDTGEKPIYHPRISYFQLNLYRSADSCPACQPKPIGNFSIDVNTGAVSSHFKEALQTDVEESRFYGKAKGNLNLHLPATLFLKNQLADGCYYTIDYTLDSGIKSLASEQIYPLNLKTVPAPQVHIRKDVRTIGAETETVLLIEWQPRQESLRHTLQKDGKISESIIHYGLNLYRVSPDNTPEESPQGDTYRGGKPTIINPQPLRYGRFSLLNFQGQLLARQVDQFGNESESVVIFDGRY